MTGSTHLSEITFDASMDEDRTRLRGMSDMIYLKQRPTAELLGNDNWNTAIERFDASTMNREAMLVGLDMIRHTQAKMLLLHRFGSMGRSRGMAVDLLALQGGRDSQIARLVLCASSLAQRDYREAVPRFALLDNQDIEAVRLRWAASSSQASNTLTERPIHAERRSATKGQHSHAQGVRATAKWTFEAGMFANLHSEACTSPNSPDCA